MKEPRVTYQQAQALKELGFDWETDHFYNDTSDELCRSAMEFFNNYDTAYSAPTLTHVAMWLREVHKISIEPEVTGQNEWIAEIWDFSEERFTELTNHYDEVTTHNEALSIAIDHAIEYLKK